MGSSADEFRSLLTLKQKAGSHFHDAGEDEIETIAAQADALAGQEQMPFADALRVETRQTAVPYGTPRLMK